MTDTKALKAVGAQRVLSDLVPGLKWQKEGTWQKCMCPFHDDTKPSFKVGTRAPDRGKCYACGAGGDVVELAAKIWECEAGAAILRLAEMYQVGPGLVDVAPLEVAVSGELEPEVVDAHAELYARAMQLSTLEPIADYLRSRGVLDVALESRKASGGGGVPLIGGVAGSDLAAWSMAVGKNNPMTWGNAGRGVFWKVSQVGVGALVLLASTTGHQVAGIHARLVDGPLEAPRYCQVGVAPRPWQARALGPGDLVICEGAIDAMSWEAAGVQALAVHGATAWRPWYARALPEAALPIVAMDRDPAGRRAQARIAAELAANGWPVRVIDITDPLVPKDANEVLMHGGIAALQAILATARPFNLSARHDQAEVAGAPNGPPLAARAPVRTPGDRAEARGGSGGPTAPPPRDPPATPAEAPREEGAMGALGVPLSEHVLFGHKATLPEVIEEAHWHDDGQGGRKRAPTVQPIYHLTDAVIRWIEAQGGIFLRDSGGAAYLYVGSRLYRMDLGDPAWKGWLYHTGRIVLTDREGRAIASALEQYALSRHDAPEPRPWMWHDRDSDGVAIHLHDDGDQVALVEPGKVRLERNGSNGVLLLRDDSTRTIRWGNRRPSAEWALGALDELVVKGLACEPAHRSLVLTWAISALVRHRLDTKMILFCTGAAGAGKTEAAKLVTTLWHGVPRVLQSTVAALWAEGERQPIVALDNQESAQLTASEGLVQWLLVAATGAQRTKRLEGTSSGVLSQRADALALVTAIEPPALDELIQRVVLVRFRHALHAATYSSAATIAELQKVRGRVMVGLLDLLAHGILPRLAEVRAVMATIPTQHPKKRLGQHLAVCALVADAVHNVRPGMWGTGQAELSGWLEAQAASAAELARGSDPVLDALQRLLWDWNRIVVERGAQGGPVRPAFEEARYRCRPLYRDENGAWTDDEGQAEPRIKRQGATFGQVAGVRGSYTDLHADLLRVCRESSAGPAFAKRIGTPSVLAARWHNNTALAGAGWRAIQTGRSGRDGRTFHFQLEEVGV